MLSAYAREGDVQSLSRLVVRNAAWMTALLKGLLPCAADADDAFQEAWLRVMRSARGYRGGSVRAYLTRVARSVAIDRYRRKGVPTESLDASEEGTSSLSETLVDMSPTPVEAFSSRADAEQVLRAVRQLPAGPRQTFLLRVEGGLQFREIAEELSVPLGTALTWMRTATIRLKRRWER